MHEADFIDIDGMVDGEFGDWQIAIAVDDHQLIVQFRRKDGADVSAWGPTYEATGKRGVVRFVRGNDENQPLVG